MADNTAQTGSDTIATDDLSTLNGGASGSVKVQRFKVGYGSDGDLRDVDTTHGLPIQSADLGATADAAATTDTGTFSLISLFKRLLGKFPAALGQATAALSFPVTLSNENILDQYITGQGSQTAFNQNVLLASAGTGSIDCQQYRTIVVQIVAAAGTVTGGQLAWEQSNDNVNWTVSAMYQAGGSFPNSGVSLSTGSTLWAGPVTGRYFRCRISSGVTGTTTGIQAFTILRMATFSSYYIAVAQNAAATLQATVTQLTPSNLQCQASATLVASSALAADTGVQYRGNATGAATIASIISAAATTAASIKASAGRIVGWQLNNSSATLRSVKVFNTLVGSVTMGTTAAAFEIDIPAGGSSYLSMDGGAGFTTALVYAVTSAKGLTDNTSTGLAAGDVSGSFFYA